MKNFKEDVIKIYQTERGILLLMILNFVTAIALLVFSLANLNPDISVTKVGYSDIVGYRDGAWTDMLAFPTLAIIFGVLHSFLALKIFHKRGAGMTKFFLIVTLLLILSTFLVIVRLNGEG